MQEIVRDVPKEYRNVIKELVKTKQYNKIEAAIEGLKFELGGEYKAVKKLDWIKEIETKVKENKKRHDAKEKIKTGNNIKESHVELKFMKEILKMKEFSEMSCSF